MLDQVLNKLERKFGRFAIPNLMSIILVGMVVIYCADILITFNPDAEAPVSSLFDFRRERIFSGEVWRLITFVFLPPDVGILFAVFEFYFIWLLGVGLENRWGSFKFNIYFLIGMLSTMAVGFWVGYAVNYYMILTLFLAFAYLFPNFEVLLFFFIPVKIKWLGLIEGLALLITFIVGGWVMKLFLLASVLNFVVFFGKDLVLNVYYRLRRFYHLKLKKRK